jgi:centriolar protein POC1
VWDTRSRQLIQHYPAHTDSVTSISIHPSGNFLLSSSKDAVLKIWDLREGRLLYSLQGHSGPVNAAQFSADGSFFASGGADQLVMVWKSNLDQNTEPGVEWGVTMPPPPPVKAIPKISSKPSKLAAGVSLGHGSPLKELVMTQSAVEAQASSPGTSKIPIPQRLAPRTPPPAAKVAAPLAVPAGKPSEGLSPVRAVTQQAPTSPSRTVAPVAGAPVAGAGAMEQTLGRILGQLDLVTKTLISMENRLTLNEDRLTSLMLQQTGGGGGVIEAGTFDDEED